MALVGNTTEDMTLSATALNVLVIFTVDFLASKQITSSFHHANFVGLPGSGV